MSCSNKTVFVGCALFHLPQQQLRAVCCVGQVSVLLIPLPAAAAEGRLLLCRPGVGAADPAASCSS